MILEERRESAFMLLLPLAHCSTLFCPNPLKCSASVLLNSTPPPRRPRTDPQRGVAASESPRCFGLIFIKAEGLFGGTTVSLILALIFSFFPFFFFVASSRAFVSSLPHSEPTGSVISVSPPRLERGTAPARLSRPDRAPQRRSDPARRTSSWQLGGSRRKRRR